MFVILQAIEKMKKHVDYKVKVVELECESREKFTPIPNISGFNNFRFAENEVCVWRQYGIGTGKNFLTLLGYRSVELLMT